MYFLCSIYYRSYCLTEYQPILISDYFELRKTSCLDIYAHLPYFKEVLQEILDEAKTAKIFDHYFGTRFYDVEETWTKIYELQDLYFQLTGEFNEILVNIK